MQYRISVPISCVICTLVTRLLSLSFNNLIFIAIRIITVIMKSKLKKNIKNLNILDGLTLKRVKLLPTCNTVKEANISNKTN